MNTRRDLLFGGSMSLGLMALGAGSALGRPRDGDQPYDLLIKGGRVIDPSQGLNSLCDIGVRAGRIAALAPVIRDAVARKTLYLTGQDIVVPGLVDLHTHVYPEGAPLAVRCDDFMVQNGSTTFVDAGDAGVNNYWAFEEEVIKKAKSRMYAFLNVSVVGLLGFPVGELLLPEDLVSAVRAAEVLKEHPQYLLGMKVRASNYVVGNSALPPIDRALEALELAGTGGRLMCHIGAVPGELDAVLKRMRPGDIITHVYSGAGNNVIQDGKLMSAALQAQQRGVIMDVGHGATAFDFTIAQTAIAQGLRPDTISSDLHKPGITGPGKAFLPWVMSKFLSLGLSLDEVIRLASVAPAQIIGRIDNLGTLKLGATADIAVMTLVHEPVQFLDTRNNVRRGDQYLRPRQTFRAGQPCEDNSSRNYAYPA